MRRSGPPSPCRRAMRPGIRGIQHDAAIAQIRGARYTCDTGQGDPTIGRTTISHCPIMQFHRDPTVALSCPAAKTCSQSRGPAAMPNGQGAAVGSAACRCTRSPAFRTGPNEHRIDLAPSLTAPCGIAKVWVPTRVMSAGDGLAANREPRALSGHGIDRQQSGELLHRSLDDRHADSALRPPSRTRHVDRPGAQMSANRAAPAGGPGDTGKPAALLAVWSTRSTSMQAPSSAISES